MTVKGKSIRLVKKTSEKLSNWFKTENLITNRSKMDQDNVRNSKTEKQTSDEKQNSLFQVTLNLVYRFIGVFVRFLMKNVFFGAGAVMPPINNLIILESANTLAMKIRTRKVSGDRL